MNTGEKIGAICIIIGFLYIAGIANFTGKWRAWNIAQILRGGLFNIWRPVIFTGATMIGVIAYNRYLPDPARPSLLVSCIIIAFIAALMELSFMIHAMLGNKRPELPYNA